MSSRVAAFYRANPRMVSSPFGGIDDIQRDLLTGVLQTLRIDFTDCHVLDVGCGRGFTAEVIHSAGGVYTGLDLVPNGQGFPLAAGDAQALPFAGESFDRAMCIDAFEHLPDPHAAAREFFRVLKPGGIFFLSAPNYGNVAGLVKKTCEGVGLYERNTWAPFGRWQPQEWETLLTAGRVRRIFRNAGFQGVRRIGYGREVGLGLFPWTDHPRMPEAIQFRLQRLFHTVGPAIARVWPGASLHGFWRMDRPPEAPHAR